MSTTPAALRDDPAGGPLVPPIPSKIRRQARRKKDQSPLIWAWSLVIGVALGIAAYQWVPNVDLYFDYWLALLLG